MLKNNINYKKLMQILSVVIFTKLGNLKDDGRKSECHSFPLQSM